MRAAGEIRVLLVEDSRAQRETLAWIIANRPTLKLAGEALNGAQAVEMVAELLPDIVLMDCHMPVLDGIAATREIMARHPVPIIMTSATSDNQDVHPGLEALRYGALAVIPKPLDPTDADFDRLREEMCLTLEMLADVRVAPTVAAPPASHAPPGPRREAPRTREELRLVAIGASTGGPPVILQILREIGASADVPVVIVQHMCAGFVAGFASWLGRSTGRAVEIARAGDLPLGGHAYVASEHGHLALDSDGRFLVEDGPPENGFRPSISHLFRSVAQVHGPHALGVLLTGMGQDGAEGLAAILRHGGLTVVQDKESSVVFGMPGTAIRIGAAQRVLSPAAIGRFILAQLATRRVPT